MDEITTKATRALCTKIYQILFKTVLKRKERQDRKRRHKTTLEDYVGGEDNEID